MIVDSADKVAPDHPAPFSQTVLEQMRVVLDELLPRGTVLDPFAGIGRVHELATDTRNTTGLELEPEWAMQHPRTLIGDATKMPWPNPTFDAIATSPCYGNRMADHHEARDASERVTYRHKLGRPLSDNSAGAMQWGAEYRELHARAWRECKRALNANGLFLLNISNHIRKGKEQRVSEWHLDYLTRVLGFELVRMDVVGTPRMKYGQNRDARVGCEWLFTLMKG